MKSAVVLKMGTEAFTLINILEKAAVHKGLKLLDNSSARQFSKPIKTYRLTDARLAMFAERKINRQLRPDCRDEIFTLVDENPQKIIRGWSPSNCWNFKLAEDDKQSFDLRIDLSVEFKNSAERRGVILRPWAHGTFVSACDELPNFRMFQALVENDNDAPPIAQEIVANSGDVIVTWTDIGLGGIRTIINLFWEFTGSNETVRQLVQRQEVLSPYPFQKGSSELYITEPTQPRIFDAWRAQLEDYRQRLFLVA